MATWADAHRQLTQSALRSNLPESSSSRKMVAVLVSAFGKETTMPETTEARLIAAIERQNELQEDANNLVQSLVGAIEGLAQELANARDENWGREA